MKIFVPKTGLLLIILLGFFLKSYSQTDTVFWFSAPEANRYHAGGSDISPDNTGTPVYLHLTTFEDPSTVTISMPANSAFFNGGSPIDTFITANTTVRLDLTDYVDDGLVNQWSSMENKLRWTTTDLAALNPYMNMNNKGIKVSSTSKITTYYEIGIQYNMDLIPLKGENALGTQFYVPFQTTNQTRVYNFLYRPYSSIDIVATEDLTKINITVDKEIWAKDWVPENLPAGTYSIWLNKGETSIITPYDNIGGAGYQTSFFDRLAGAYVEVDQTEGSGGPIAILTHDDIVKSNFSGNPDYVIDQIIPIEHIGTDYAVIQGVGYDETLPGLEIEDFVYVVGTQAGTNFTVKRGPGGYTSTHSVGVGGTVAIAMDSLTKRVVTVNSDQPVYVYHMSGAGRQKAGAIIPTISTCTGSYKVAFNRTKGGTYAFYLNILARTTAVGSFGLTKETPLDADDLNMLAEFNDIANYDTLPEIGDPYDKWIYARFDASDLDAGLAYLLTNTDNYFHLGVLNGRTGDDAFYGYFSNFNQNEAGGVVVNEGGLLGYSCPGDTIWLEASGGHTYTWTPSNYLDYPDSSRTSAVLPAGSGIHTYQVRVQGECDLDSTITLKVEAYGTPDVFFTLSDYTACAPAIIDFQNESLGGDNFDWDFENDGSFEINDMPDSAGTAQWTYQNTGNSDTTFQIRVVGKYSGIPCSDEFMASLQVFPEIHAGFDPDFIFGCNPLTVTFADTSYGNLDKYKWVYGDGVTSVMPEDTIHTYSHIITNDTVDFDVELQLTSPYFCRDTARATISVFSYLETGFTIDEDRGCSPLDVTINDISAGADTIFIDFGDGTDTTIISSFTNITHRYIDTTFNVDTNIIVMRVKNDEGCELIHRDTVIVYPEFVANYTISSNSVCNSDTITFVNTTQDGIYRASRYLWTFGDGANMDTTNATINHFYENNTAADDTLDFILYAESQYGCWDDTTNQIILYRAQAGFTINTDEGCSPLDVDIENTSVGSINTYDWDYGNGISAGPVPNDPTYINVSDVTDTIEITLIVTGNGGCTTTHRDTVMVYPEISVSFDTTLTHITSCDSLTVEFASSVIHAGLAPTTIYSWDLGDGSTSSLDTVVHTYTNLNNPDSIIRYVRLDVATPYGCTDFAIDSVVVYPKVDAQILIDQTEGCSPFTVDIAGMNLQGNDVYAWDYGGGVFTIGDDQDPGPYQYPVNRSFLPALPDGDTIYTIQLDVQDISGTCTDFDTVSITIYSEIVADFFPKNTSVCNGDTITFTDASSANAAVWDWNFGDGSSYSGVNPPPHIYENLNDYDSTFTTTLSVESDRGCTHDTSATNSIYRYVEANFDINTGAGCSPLDITITNNSRGGNYFWYWDSNDGAGGEDSNTLLDNDSFTHRYINTSGVNDTVRLFLRAENADGCSDTLSRMIVIYSSMEARFVSLSGLVNCNEFEVQFDNTTLSADAEYFTWDYGDGTSTNTTSASPDPALKTFVNNSNSDTIFTITLTAESEYGCSHDTTLDITVWRNVDADFDIDISERCSPLDVTITNFSQGGDYYWFWDDNAPFNLGAPDDQTTDGDPPITHQYLNENTGIDSIYMLTLIAWNNNPNCYDTMQRAITVHSTTIADFTIDDGEGCNEHTAEFTNLSSFGTNYRWFFGDGTTSNDVSPTHTFENLNNTDYTYTVRLIAETADGCTNEFDSTVTVYSYVKAAFVVVEDFGCPPFETSIPNTSFGHPNNIYNWYVAGSLEEGPVVGLSDFEHVYDNITADTVSYLVELIATSFAHPECKDTATTYITVAEEVDAQFSVTTIEGCSPLDVTFTDQSVVPPNTLYQWNFRDGSTSTSTGPTVFNKFHNPSRTNDDSFDVRLIVTSPLGCSDTTTTTIDVYHKPLSQFGIDITADCPPLITEMRNQSQGHDIFEWRFGDGNTNNTDNIVTWEYGNTNSDVLPYTLELYVATSNGCEDISTLNLNVYPEVIASFTYDSMGCSPFVSKFVSTSLNASYHTWDFDDNSTSNQAETSHRFDNTWIEDREYDVILRAYSEYGCEDFDTNTVTVYAQPITEFDVTPLLQTFPESRVFINNQSNTGPWDYLWDFGDGLTSTDAEPDYHDYVHWGEYDIKLRIQSQTNLCVDSIINSVTILAPDITAEFTPSPSAGCAPLTVQFDAQASAFAETYEFTWDFGDGTLSEGASPIHTYEEHGTYLVKMTAKGEGGEALAFHTVNVYRIPEVSFRTAPRLALLDLNLQARVEFYNLSVCGGDTVCYYLWDLGDGNTSSAEDYVHYYTEIGVYDVSLVATSANGCVDSVLKVEEVEIYGEGEITFPNAFTPSLDGPYEGEYDITNPETLNDVFFPVWSGVIEYELYIYNRWGELIFESDNIDIGWDGYVDGKLAKQDVYVWKAVGKFTDGRAFEIAGDVTLVR